MASALAKAVGGHVGWRQRIEHRAQSVKQVTEGGTHDCTPLKGVRCSHGCRRGITPSTTVLGFVHGCRRGVGFVAGRGLPGQSPGGVNPKPDNAAALGAL